MTKIVSFVNLKGGVGKTTLAVSFATYCVRNRKRTLLIDLDPQTNATFWAMGFDAWEASAKSTGTVADLLGAGEHKKAESGKRSAASVLVPNVKNFGFDLIPSHLDLYTIDLDLASVPLKELKLKRALEPILANYDFVVCDCPPNLTIPTQNALAISTHYVVPTALDFLSALGIGLLINRVNLLGEDLDNEPELAGVVISRAGSRPGLVRETTEASLRSSFGDQVLAGRIKDRSDVITCSQSRISVFDSGNSDVINEFSHVCRDLLSNIEGPKK
jgi:chromosome partitioning protein